ncbi:MAG: alpha-glucosidase [Clostridia bacterium]|nr:alpha-glucosidase [Clostridia bacterium]
MARNVKSDTVVYQIYPRSYMDSDGDGIGDIPGIISRLDYIASLGVNTIWLSPVYASPDDDNGYDISDYKAIQPHFGTMEDFDRLIAEARARGIDIVMDLVINHTSDEHEWFRRALAGEEKYRNYYIIKEGKGGKLPNNWGNFFAECPWTKFGDSENEYYLHLFSKKQPDLNWHNPDVLAEIEDIMHFWLEKGVAGFRCDVINIIYKNSYEDGKKKLILTGSEHYLSTDGCHEILAKLRSACLEPYKAWAVGETVFVDIDQARKLTDVDRGELDMAFSFEHMEVDQVIVKWFRTKLKPKKLMRTISKWQTGLDWNAVYFENHDQPRFISRLVGARGYREEASKMMAGLVMTLRGTPFIFEGQEIGMTNFDYEDMSDVMDIESHNIYNLLSSLHLPKRLRWRMIRLTSRDNARTPMQWTDGEHAGFTEGTPWLKVNGNHKTVNVKTEERKADGVLAFWKRMIALRKTSDALKEGGFEPLYEGGRIYAYRRRCEGESLVAIFNMTAKEAKLPRALKVEGEVIASNYDTHGDALLPFEFELIREEA